MITYRLTMNKETQVTFGTNLLIFRGEGIFGKTWLAPGSARSAIIS